MDRRNSNRPDPKPNIINWLIDDHEPVNDDLLEDNEEIDVVNVNPSEHNSLNKINNIRKTNTENSTYYDSNYTIFYNTDIELDDECTGYPTILSVNERTNVSVDADATLTDEQPIISVQNITSELGKLSSTTSITNGELTTTNESKSKLAQDQSSDLFKVPLPVSRKIRVVKRQLKNKNKKISSKPENFKIKGQLSNQPSISPKPKKIKLESSLNSATTSSNLTSSISENLPNNFATSSKPKIISNIVIKPVQTMKWCNECNEHHFMNLEEQIYECPGCIFKTICIKYLRRHMLVYCIRKGTWICVIPRL